MSATDRVAVQSGAVATCEVLVSLGFKADPDVISDPPGGFSLDLGILKLEASYVINRWFQPCVLLGGVLNTGRTIGTVHCEMPRVVESLEQGVAWVAWCLDKQAKEVVSSQFVSPWIEEGRHYRHLLPWERRMAAYDARPHCVVDRAWAKLALRSLAELLARCDESELLRLFFDGEILTLRPGSAVLAMPAKGARWPNPFGIPASALKQLPRRLMHEEVEFGIWEGRLVIGNRAYKGVIPVERGNS